MTVEFEALFDSLSVLYDAAIRAYSVELRLYVTDEMMVRHPHPDDFRRFLELRHAVPYRITFEPVRTEPVIIEGEVLSVDGIHRIKEKNG